MLLLGSYCRSAFGAICQLFMNYSKIQQRNRNFHFQYLLEINHILSKGRNKENREDQDIISAAGVFCLINIHGHICG